MPVQYFRPRFDFLRGAFVHNMAVVDDVGAISVADCNSSGASRSVSASTSRN
jgi:hypothetical protein